VKGYFVTGKRTQGTPCPQMNWVLNRSEKFAKRGVPIVAAGRADNSGTVESLSGEFFPGGHYKLFALEHNQVFAK